MIIAINNETRN